MLPQHVVHVSYKLDGLAGDAGRLEEHGVILQLEFLGS